MPPVVPPNAVPQRVVPPPALVQQQPAARRSSPAFRVAQPPPPSLQPIAQRSRPVARAPPPPLEMVRPSRPVVRQAPVSHVQQTRLRRARSRPGDQAAPPTAVIPGPPPVEMIQRPSRPVVQRALASAIQGSREHITSVRSRSRPSAQQSTASANQATGVRRVEPRSRSRSRPAGLPATAPAPAPVVRKVKKRSAQSRHTSIVSEQASIVVQSPVRDRSGSPTGPDPILLAPEPGPGPLPSAGVAVPGDFPPPNIHEADIYHAHPAGPPRAPPVERRYSPPPYQPPIAFEMDGGSVRRGAASITGTLPRHASQRARRARAAVFDYFSGARFMGMRRVVGTELNIFHVPTAPANAGPPSKTRPQPQQPPGAYLAPNDDD